MTKQPFLKLILLQLSSVFLFSLALILMVPPVPSQPKSTYQPMPAVFFAGVLLAVSLFAGRRAGLDPLWKIAAQAVIFIVYGYILFERVQMP